MPHVGFLVLTDAARRVGIRDRSEVGLAADTDFAIRLGQIYRGSAHAFVDRVTIQTRLEPHTLSWTSQDVSWKLYDIVAGIDNLSPEEARARDRLLARVAPHALREHALAHRRKAALRIMLSSAFRQRSGLIRMAYSATLIALPRLAFAMRSRWRSGFDWLPAATLQKTRPTSVPTSVFAAPAFEPSVHAPTRRMLQAFARRASR
jgi:hypothetical protein